MRAYAGRVLALAFEAFDLWSRVYAIRPLSSLCDNAPGIREPLVSVRRDGWFDHRPQELHPIAYRDLVKFRRKRVSQTKHRFDWQTGNKPLRDQLSGGVDILVGEIANDRHRAERD